jgi:hypothetical protein
LAADAREWIEKVEALQRELDRLELTEVTESTLREALERERERADEERDRANRLEEELREARRPWWRRVFWGRNLPIVVWSIGTSSKERLRGGVRCTLYSRTFSGSRRLP